MTSRRLPSDRRRRADVRGDAATAVPVDPAAERFARAWDAVRDGAALDDVVGAMADDAALADLVRLADAAARQLPAAVDGRVRARQRAFLESAAARRRGTRLSGAGAGVGWRWAWPQLALRLGAAVIAASLGLGSAVVASANDLPGDTLYGVKRAAESARLALTFDPDQRAAYHVALAELRLSEIRALIDRGRSPSAAVIEALLGQWTAALTAARGAADPAAAERAAAARTTAADGLRSLAARSPEAATLLGAAATALDPPARPAPPPDRPRSPRGALPSAPTSPASMPTSTPSTGAVDAAAPGSAVPGGAVPSLAPAPVALPTETLSLPPATTSAPGGPGEPTDVPPPATAQPGPPAEPTDAAPPATAPPEPPENPRANERATEMAERPPDPTRSPQRTPRRP